MKLYKYKSLPNEESIDQLIEMMNNDAAYFSSYDQINDVFDLSPVIDFYIKTEKQLQSFIEFHRYKGINEDALAKANIRIAEELKMNGFVKLPGNESFFETVRSTGIMCLTTNCYSPAMWGHYSDKGTGVLIEYEIPSEMINKFVFEVEYAMDRPIVDPYDIYSSKNDPDYINVVFRKMILTKHSDWSFEKEWRLVNPSSSRCLVKNIIQATRIIFGPRCEHIERIASQLKQSITKVRAEISNNKYRVEFQ